MDLTSWTCTWTDTNLDIFVAVKCLFIIPYNHSATYGCIFPKLLIMKLVAHHRLMGQMVDRNRDVGLWRRCQLALTALWSHSTCTHRNALPDTDFMFILPSAPSLVLGAALTQHLALSLPLPEFSCPDEDSNKRLRRLRNGSQTTICFLGFCKVSAIYTSTRPSCCSPDLGNCLV